MLELFSEDKLVCANLQWKDNLISLFIHLFWAASAVKNIQYLSIYCVTHVVKRRGFSLKKNRKLTWEFLMPGAIVNHVTMPTYGQCTMCCQPSLKKNAQKGIFFFSLFFCWLLHSAFSYKIPHCCYWEKYWFWVQLLRDHSTANTHKI